VVEHARGRPGDRFGVLARLCSSVGIFQQVVCLTTGHLLKDPDAAAEAGEDPEPVPGTTAGVLDHLGE
jgi:threonine synthase